MDRLQAFAARLAGLTGWQRAVTALALGGLATLALPPLGAVPVLLITFPGLLWLLDGAKSGRQAFLIGWLFGWAHFVLGLYWISFSLFTDIARFWWALPFAAGGLPVVLAIFVGLATWIVHKSRLHGASRVALFAVAWTAGEWLRGHVFTGFPWNLIGYSWTDVLPVLQTAAYIGAYGISLLTVWLVSLPALLGWALPKARIWVAAGAVLLLAMAGGGAWRLAAAGDVAPTVPGVRLRLVQPNIPQSLKWEQSVRLDNFRRHLALSTRPAPVPPTHIIWPETAVSWTLNDQPQLQEAIAQVVPPGGMVVTGAPRSENNEGKRSFFNSVFAIDDTGTVVGTADKFHLVPFGEYLPFRGILPVTPIAAGATDFSAGPGPVTLNTPGLPPFSTLVCYEVIFPGRVADPNNKPGWLLNVTNDAWFGRSAGPHQHFAIARVRAVEEGIPLVRAANTGISGVVDPYGRVTVKLDLGQEGVADADLPQALETPTLYSRLGDWVLLFLMLISGAGIAREWPRTSRTAK